MRHCSACRTITGSTRVARHTGLPVLDISIILVTLIFMTTETAVTDSRLERVFHALSDMKRLRILEILRSGECCVCDLADSLDIRQSLLSFHLRTLRDADLVSDRKEGRWVHYALNEETLTEARDYVDELARDAQRRVGFQCCRHARA
jgi:ArsR family transcriptional regulator